MMKRTAIVTGANSGFGKLITIGLAKQGYKVIAGVRQEANAKSLLKKSSKPRYPHRYILKH